MIEYYPLLKTVFDLIEPKSVAKLRHDHFHYTASRVDKRLSKESDKHDIWNLLLESDILSTKEMHSNAELFMTAGTETSCTCRDYPSHNNNIANQTLYQLLYLLG